MAFPRSFEDRIDLARRVARPAALVLWIGSAFTSLVGVPGTWLVPLLALCVAAMALPTRAPAESPPIPWTVAFLGFAFALIGGVRAAIHGTSEQVALLFIILLCGESMVALVPAWIGQRIDDALAPRLANGRGRMRYATIAATLLGVAGCAVTLTRFPGRLEPPVVEVSAGRTSASLLGVYQPLGSRCPWRCDQGPRAVSRGGSDLLASVLTDDLGRGSSLLRERNGPMTTRARILVTPPGYAPRYVFDRTLFPGHELRISGDAAGRYLTVDYAQHPRFTVRLADGATFTEHQRAAEGETAYHAPTPYVPGALLGIAVAAGFLAAARRDRRKASDQGEWRDAKVEDDGMVHFERELPPAPLPEGTPEGSSDVVVTRVTAPVGTGYRSDGVVTIHEMFRGSRDDLLAHLAARATAWEHGAFACVVVAHAPLVGVWLMGETW